MFFAPDFSFFINKNPVTYLIKEIKEAILGLYNPSISYFYRITFFKGKWLKKEMYLLNIFGYVDWNSIMKYPRAFKTYVIYFITHETQINHIIIATLLFLSKYKSTICI